MQSNTMVAYAIFNYGNAYIDFVLFFKVNDLKMIESLYRPVYVIDY